MDLGTDTESSTLYVVLDDLQKLPVTFRTTELFHFPSVVMQLFTSSCQMGVIMNAFIANVIKPNITSIQGEADSTVPTERPDTGLALVCIRKLHWKSVSQAGLPTQNKFLCS